MVKNINQIIKRYKTVREIMKMILDEIKNSGITSSWEGRSSIIIYDFREYDFLILIHYEDSYNHVRYQVRLEYLGKEVHYCLSHDYNELQRLAEKLYDNIEKLYNNINETNLTPSYEPVQCQEPPPPYQE